MAGQWIFGYGSLVWRPDFRYRERRPGFLRGFARRFWQASTDHRGTPEAPGRVVTLLEESAAVCWGMAYHVANDVAVDVLEKLDHREKGGYRRVESRIHFGSGEPSVAATVYVATPDNPNYVGPQLLEDIARVARESHGPSGSNREYVVRLHRALIEMGATDEHVAALAALVSED